MTPAVITGLPAGSPFKTAIDRHDAGPLHPGEVLREDYLPHWRLDPRALAVRLGIDAARIEDVIGERIPMTADLAARLGQVFGVPPRFWLALQMQYDLWHARSGPGARPR